MCTEEDSNDNAWSMYGDLSWKQLHQPSLKEVKYVLAEELKKHFVEVTVKVTSCPCLNKEPYNLVGCGLRGNAVIFEYGDYSNFISESHINADGWNMRDILSRSYYNSFLIGGCYTTAPMMLVNGNLVVNAKLSLHAEVESDSHIVYENVNEGNRQRIETIDLDGRNSMICSLMGNFFMSEGRPGRVIEVRAKIRKHNAPDIITIIQAALHSYYSRRKKVVGLGGILVAKKGIVLQKIIPGNIPRKLSTKNEVVKFFSTHYTDCTSDLIALGTIISREPYLSTGQNYNDVFLHRHHHFHVFPKGNVAGGHFIDDISPYTTEYVGYFNVASKIFRIGEYGCCS